MLRYARCRAESSRSSSGSSSPPLYNRRAGGCGHFRCSRPNGLRPSQAGPRPDPLSVPLLAREPRQGVCQSAVTAPEVRGDGDLSGGLGEHYARHRRAKSRRGLDASGCPVLCRDGVFLGVLPGIGRQGARLSLIGYNYRV
eukprot:1077509-Prorocentrum_minimum.AAC.4